MNREMTDNKNKKRGHAVALFSGGLDSALAILLMLKQNIEVTAVTFMTHFGCDLGDRSSCGSNPYPAAEKYGFNVKLMHLADKFVDIVKNPQHGRGANMNVCVDCRILMLREAAAYADMIKADFIITGEVMGQRPFSQVKSKMELVLKESGLEGRLLRPLSAKLLSPTEAEKSGLVDRELLEGISGRSRKRQIEMANELGLDDYPSPASGCLLTDSNYSNRLRDLMAHTDRMSFNDLNLLRVGRQFRLSDCAKLIVGKNEADNKSILAQRQPGHILLEAPEVGSPISLLIGNPDKTVIEQAAQITARYSSGRKEPLVKVAVDNGSDKYSLAVTPAGSDQYSHLSIN